MQYAKCMKSNVRRSWLKKGFATNFETQPRFRIIFVHFLNWSFQCMFFPCRQKRGRLYFLWILKERPAAGATFQCLDCRQKELIPSIWSPLKNRHYTFKQKHCFIFFYFFTLFLIYLCCLFLFSMILFFYVFVTFLFDFFVCVLFVVIFCEFCVSFIYLFSVFVLFFMFYYFFFKIHYEFQSFWLKNNRVKKSKFLKIKVSPWISGNLRKQGKMKNIKKHNFKKQ